ncbi:MAG: hypothetical protein AAF226_07625 [Verrucomicrobiota bacterium]
MGGKFGGFEVDFDNLDPICVSIEPIGDICCHTVYRFLQAFGVL